MKRGGVDQGGRARYERAMHPRPAFRALAHRNYRLYFVGQGTSLVGTWMQQVAAAWLVFQLTDSPAWLGIVVFAGQAPALVVSPLAGAVIDRSDRRWLVLLTQALSLVQASVLAALTLSGSVTVWQVIALSLFLGIVNALDIPARQALLADLVGSGDDLANAIALNSSAFNSARLIGPALAGLLLAQTSAGVCFLVNALSYVAVLAALLAMRLPQRALPADAGPLWSGIREGLAYTWNQPALRAVLLLVGLISTAGTAVSTLLPALAKELPGGGASAFGLLTAASGVGALLAAGYLACRRGLSGLTTCLAAAPVLFGLGTAALSFAGTLGTSALLLALTGFALVLLSASGNTLLQSQADEDKRGRVMSLYTAAVTGAAPLGGLFAGQLADSIGVACTLSLAGVASLAAALAFLAQLFRQRRPAATREVLLVKSFLLRPSSLFLRPSFSGEPKVTALERMTKDQ
jgi:MFS family permease